MDAAGARLERVRYPRPEAGGEVEAWRLSPREPRARVVAAHGAGNDALYPQLALFEALVRRGVEVFAFDIDGHGAGSTTLFSPDTVPSAIAAAVAQAERGRPALPLHLLGHSFGGSLVLHALAEGAVAHAASAVVVSAPTLHLPRCPDRDRRAARVPAARDAEPAAALRAVGDGARRRPAQAPRLSRSAAPRSRARRSPTSPRSSACSPGSTWTAPPRRSAPPSCWSTAPATGSFPPCRGAGWRSGSHPPSCWRSPAPRTGARRSRRRRSRAPRTGSRRTATSHAPRRWHPPPTRPANFTFSESTAR